MSLALDVDLASPVVPSASSVPSRRLVAAGADPRPVFVDESGRRARWFGRLLALCTLIAVAFMLTVAVLAVAFTRSAGADTWAAGPDQVHVHVHVHVHQTTATAAGSRS